MRYSFSAFAAILVVALGAKKGQEWIQKNLPRISVAVVSHLGAVVNFIGGSIARAPVAVQRLGFEWLWRIKEEPMLWRRYLMDGLQLTRLLLKNIIPSIINRIYLNISLASQPANIVTTSQNGVCKITLGGDFIFRNQSLRDLFNSLARQKISVIFNMASVANVDLEFIGILILLFGHQKKYGLGFRLDRVPQHLRRILELNKADYLMAAI